MTGARQHGSQLPEQDGFETLVCTKRLCASERTASSRTGKISPTTSTDLLGENTRVGAVEAA